MNKPVDYSHLIKPICLPQSDDVIGSGISGTVVGYGKSESPGFYENTPKHVEIETVNIVDCLLSHSGFQSLVSERTFCAGGKYGRSPCKGWEKFHYFLVLNT